jgi:hypothetical protein
MLLKIGEKIALRLKLVPFTADISENVSMAGNESKI